MKRLNQPRYWLLALVLPMACGTAWLMTRNTSQSRVTRANFEKIKEGMSHEEVRAILGESWLLSGDSFGVDACYWDSDPRPPWEWERVGVAVYFKEGKVEEARFEVAKKTWAEWFQGWRDWAGL